jgi:hypothetical protein
MACIDSIRHRQTPCHGIGPQAGPGFSWIGQRLLLSRDRRFVIDVIASFPYDEILEGDQSELKSSKVPKPSALPMCASPGTYPASKQHSQ